MFTAAEDARTDNIINTADCCPLEQAFSILGGKWKSRIICILSNGEFMRYSKLKSELIDISDTVLAATLKCMLKDGLLERMSFPDEFHPHVEYKLSEYGMSVLPILKEMCIWAISSNAKEKSSKRCLSCQYLKETTNNK
ncbi:MAG: winged helix-turn-helix transcriptional regulator [Succinivibrio sp.]